jgi:hypothetical protein
MWTGLLRYAAACSIRLCRLLQTSWRSVDSDPVKKIAGAYGARSGRAEEGDFAFAGHRDAGQFGGRVGMGKTAPDSATGRITIFSDEVVALGRATGNGPASRLLSRPRRRRTATAADRSPAGHAHMPGDGGPVVTPIDDEVVALGRATGNFKAKFGTAEPEFETAPFDRSGTSPSAIREGREVSRWRPASTARQTREV